MSDGQQKSKKPLRANHCQRAGGKGYLLCGQIGESYVIGTKGGSNHELSLICVHFEMFLLARRRYDR